jgi:hypothetical protein
MAMSGAFTPPGQEDGPGANGPQFRGPTGADLLNANPNQYMIQGLPSVNYNSTDPNRRYTMPDIAVGSNYYGAPRFADGGEVGHYAFGGTATGTATADPNAPLDPNARFMLGGIDMTDFLKNALSSSKRTSNANNLVFANSPEEYSVEEKNIKRRAPFTRKDIVVELRSKGIAGLATGGYPRKTGQISGPGTATSDSIPAMLSDGEFVMTAKAVRGLGKGSRREGAKRMYALMHQLERNAARG